MSVSRVKSSHVLTKLCPEHLRASPTLLFCCQRKGATGMEAPETEKEIFSYLSSCTRGLSQGDLGRFTTQGVSRALTVSRNLASHYLNDLVRTGLAVKAGGHPVYYFAKHDLERILQRPLSEASYASVDVLMGHRDVDSPRDFEAAVGADLSLSYVIERLKSAVKYPPYGLPILISGEPGVGKSYLASLTFAYGRNACVIDKDARFVLVNCAEFDHKGNEFVQRLQDMNPESWVRSCNNGFLAFDGVERLSVMEQEALAATISRCSRTGLGQGHPHFILLTTAPLDAAEVDTLSKAAPVSVHLPALSDRPIEEREELVLRFLRAEGRQLGVGVYISRSALTHLENASFKDNIRGLRSCITNCCASAFLPKREDRLIIQTFNLPPEVLSYTKPSTDRADSELVDVMGQVPGQGDSEAVQQLAFLLEVHAKLRDGSTPRAEGVDMVLRIMNGYIDELAFSRRASSDRVVAYGTMLAGGIEGLYASHNLSFSRKDVRVLAEELCVQSLVGTRLAQWRQECSAEFMGLLVAIEDAYPMECLVAAQVCSLVRSQLGIACDALTQLMIAAQTIDASAGVEKRQSVGVILSHGYSTATSIADAANRILGKRIYEAIDMTYDQELLDVLPALREVLDRYAYCRQIVLLVDTGSLEQLLSSFGNMSNRTVGIVNNVSTALALEVGSSLLSNESVAVALPAAVQACSYRYQVTESETRECALVFCSENGTSSAEKIRELVQQSLPTEIPLQMVACPMDRLRKNGVRDAVFSRYEVLGIVGTDDPDVEGIPFVALEDLISDAHYSKMDAILSRYLDDEGMRALHQNLVKNLTLRNVIESITILNPQRLLDEVRSAVERLEGIVGSPIDDRTMVGLCVHLCCLVERLVTRNPIETHLDLEGFKAQHQDFIDAFGKAFAALAEGYNIQINTAEIAYVYDYMFKDL